MRKIDVSPSLLAADFLHLEKEIAHCEKAHVGYLHFDVMDGHFVPNISFGLPVLKSLARRHSLINDVHIMISDPLTYGPQFAKAGADIVTFHYEALKNDAERWDVIHAIKKAGAKVGMSIKPQTEANVLIDFLPQLDLVLIMSVEPGFGGQSFMPSSLPKIVFIRDIIDRHGYPTLIEVDGGIQEDTAKLCVRAGVDILVAGSYLFGHDDFNERVTALRLG